MAASRSNIFLSPSSLIPSHFTRRRISFKVIRCSSVPMLFSSKSSKRKNYLRPKILRTLIPKPHETVVVGNETPESVPPSDVLSNQANDVEELQVSSSSVVSNEMNGILTKISPKLVAKYGLYLIGLFAFQTVCAVLFLGNSTKSEKTPDISRSLSLRKNDETASNVIFLEDLEINEKIAEIRLMAREARKSEEKSGKKEDDDETLNPGGGIDIEKEIEARLSNIDKRLKSQRKGLAALRIDTLDESGNNDLKDEKSLMFEKKHKFKAEKPSTGNVKGFGDNKRNSELMPGTVKTMQNGRVSGSRDGEENPENQQKESKITSGAAQESEERRPSNEVKQSRKSGNQVGRTPSKEAGSGFGSSSWKNGEVSKGKPMRRVREKQPEKENKMWWLKLPYVMRVLMRSNMDQEVSEGYFTLRTVSMEHNEGQVSYMIAFEDQSDARNFSYLLESFFEDLDNFTADVAPVSTKDLLEEVTSGDKNVIVVKKRQLTLYAGQPLEDVERALRTLIQEEQ